jgi:threonine/homoserine/homoserine lactone efflux protein
MGDAVGTVLPLAVAVAVFPVPIIAAVLIVSSPRGAAKGLAFVALWVVGLTAVGAAVPLLAEAADESDARRPATWVSAVLLALGLLLVAAAARQWRGRPGPGEETPTPGWMRTVDEFTVAKAAAAGFALAGLNPKNVLLAAAAALEIAAAGLPAGQAVAALLVFVLLASLGVLTPLVLSLVLGDRSRDVLDGLRGWMARHNAAIMAVILLVIGAKLIGDAVSGLTD